MIVRRCNQTIPRNSFEKSIDFLRTGASFPEIGHFVDCVWKAELDPVTKEWLWYGLRWLKSQLANMQNPPPPVGKK